MFVPRSKRARTGAVGLALSISLIGAACSSDTSTSTAPGMTTTTTSSMTQPGSSMPMTATGVGTPAAMLRSTLTDQLTTHVYLAGIGINTAVTTTPDSAATKAALAGLDANSVELSESIASVYGKPAGDEFLALWRKHIGFFVDYTLGKAGQDEAKAAKAKSDLDGYRNDFGAFMAAANPNLTKEAVAGELKTHVDSLIKAIDLVVAQDPALFGALKAAAGHMPMTAEVLSGAIAKQKLEGK